MPTRDYDPRRYGPTADVGALAASRGLQSASVAKDGFHSVQEESGTAGGARVRGGAGVLIGLPASSRGGVRPHVLLSFPDDASAPRKDRRGAPRVPPPLPLSVHSEGTITASKQQQVYQYHAEVAPSWTNNYNTMSTATATSFFGSTTASDVGAGAGPPEPEGRGRTRRRSLSWHCRQETARPPVLDSTANSSLFGSDTLDGSDGSSSTSNGNDIARRRPYCSCESIALAAGGASRRRSSSHTAGARREGKAGPQGRGRRRGGSARRGGQGAVRGESIDAEELFRRKNNMARWNVTYGRWAESYDRSVARRASLERRERLEAERKCDLRRRRAEEEFQKWARSHAPRPVSSSGSGVGPVAAPAAAAAYGAGHALGTRSTYHERASSASPLRRQWLKSGGREAWVGGEGEGTTVNSRRGGGGGGDSSGGGSSDGGRYTPLGRKEGQVPPSAGAPGGQGGGGAGENYLFIGKENWQEREKQRQRQKEEAEREEAERKRQREREEAEKRRKVDRAFCAWVDRKKKEAQAEREARRRREEALAKLRKLQASRRWKKRPVVCAYTYGAKVGAREWADNGDGGDGDAAKEGRGKEAEKEEVEAEVEKEKEKEKKNVTSTGKTRRRGGTRKQEQCVGEEEGLRVREEREARTGGHQEEPGERGQEVDGEGPRAEEGDDRRERGEAGRKITLTTLKGKGKG